MRLALMRHLPYVTGQQGVGNAMNTQVDLGGTFCWYTLFPFKSI